MAASKVPNSPKITAPYNEKAQKEIKKPKYNKTSDKMIHEDYFEGGGRQDAYQKKGTVKNIDG